MPTEEEVMEGVSHWSCWWANQRLKKLQNLATETMSINPYILGFLSEYHALESPKDLASHLASFHLHIGHLTGFGKLVDEKIIPNVFGLIKLDKATRRERGLEDARFDAIDHMLVHDDGEATLFSQKSSKWTIQLSQAKEMNAAFFEIQQKDEWVRSIVVGITYGNSGDMTDKYEITRGINRGANHEVYDLRDYVQSLVGRDFWAFINNGQQETHLWVHRGFERGIADARLHERSQALLQEFQEAVAELFAGSLNIDGSINHSLFLELVNTRQ